MIKEIINTPQGIARYPWLNTPDTKFGSPGDYKTGLIMDPSQASGYDAFATKYASFKKRAMADCVEQIQAALDEIPDTPQNKAKRAKFSGMISNIDEVFKDPLTDEYDDTGNLTGSKILDCKSKAEWKDPKSGNVISFKPEQYDSTGKPMESEVMISGGTVLCMKVTLSNYFIPATGICGIAKPKIHACQVIKLSSSGSAGGGFGAVDGGYVSEAKVTPSLPEEPEAFESADYE